MRLLRAVEVAEELGVSVPRVYELARTGLIPSVRIGRQIRFHADQLRAWVDRGGCSLPGGWRREAE